MCLCLNHFKDFFWLSPTKNMGDFLAQPSQKWRLFTGWTCRALAAVPANAWTTGCDVASGAWSPWGVSRCLEFSWGAHGGWLDLPALTLSRLSTGLCEFDGFGWWQMALGEYRRFILITSLILKSREVVFFGAELRFFNQTCSDQLMYCIQISIYLLLYT